MGHPLVEVRRFSAEPRTADARRSRGCSLVELLVALVLIGVGVLALAGGMALELRDVGAAEAEVRAVATARARLERLATSPCTAVRSGSGALAGGVTEVWTVERRAPGVLLLADSVRYPAPGGPRTVVVQGSAPC